MLPLVQLFNGAMHGAMVSQKLLHCTRPGAGQGLTLTHLTPTLVRVRVKSFLRTLTHLTLTQARVRWARVRGARVRWVRVRWVRVLRKSFLRTLVTLTLAHLLNLVGIY